MSEEKQEFIHEVDKKESEPTLDVMDLLQMELHRHMETALDLKKNIETAKTDCKKKYYDKKLKKNNVEALKVLTAIQRVEKQRKKDATRVEEVKTDDENIVA